MGTNSKNEFYDLFKFPLCIVSSQPPYSLQSCNTAFQQITGVKLESIVERHLFDDQLVDIFNGHEETMYHFLKNVDNGVGFNPAHSDKLFRVFSRLHSPRDFAGAGIGLATVKRIVNLHGGHIFAQSHPGEGATFYFNFHESK